MSQKISAGLLMYRINNSQIEVFLGHPGGPFWKNKDLGFWGIPKGELNDGEDTLEAAKREFKEETGIEFKEPLISLGSIQLKSGKVVHAWAFESDWSGHLEGTSHVSMEYPKGSKKIIKFPELDRAEFFPIEIARKKMSSTQAELLDRLEVYLKKSAQTNSSKP